MDGPAISAQWVSRRVSEKPRVSEVLRICLERMLPVCAKPLLKRLVRLNDWVFFVGFAAGIVFKLSIQTNLLRLMIYVTSYTGCVIKIAL